MATLSSLIQNYTSTETLDSVADRGATTNQSLTMGNLTSTGIDDNATSTTITIDASENVGIGGSPVSSTRRLMVKDTGDVRVDIRSGADTNLGAIDFSDTSNTARGQLVYDHNDDSMQFKTLSTERMRIDNNGTLGVGVTPATDWGDDGIQLGSKGTLSGGSSYTGYAFNAYPTSSGWASKYTTTDEASLYLQGAGLHIWYNAASGTAGTAVTWQERMRIDASGNVGIGRTPNVNGVLQLNVVSGNNCNLTFSENTVDKWLIGSVTSSDALRFYDLANAAERMRIDSAGLVGINEINPTHSLHVKGDTSDTIDETKGTLKLQGTTGGNGLIFGTIASSPYTSYIQSAFVADTSLAQYALALNPIGGNVGVGITSPDTKLHIQGSVTAGTTASTGGSDVLLAKYIDGSNDQPNIIGTSRSSAAWYICYGLRPSTATGDTFTSSVDNSTWYRGAFRVGGDYAAFRSNGGSAVNTAVGTIIATNEYVRMDHMGISFNGDTAAANHLNDYEEGTWTPSLSTGTATVLDAKYVKVGAFVYATAFIYSFSDRSTAASFEVNGLPFVSSSTHRGGSTSLYRYINRSSPVIQYVTANSSKINFYGVGTNVDYTPVYHSHLGSSASNYYLAVTYRTDA